jgi:two-component system phosphate regulon response regulator PhoB
MLPGLNGLEVCRKLKEDEATRRIPIVMVTAKGEESDIVLGLGIGAEDYITKPFHVGELLARTRAVFRRREEMNSGSIPAEVIRHEGITLDATKHALTVDGTGIEVTATEFRLLQTLLGSPGRVYSRDQLIDNVIGEDANITERTIDSHIGSVRRKLGPYRSWLKTVWGVGYRFEPHTQ